MNKSNLLIIIGPTASGKTKLAVQLANQFSGEIISADSRQVFKNMSVGTGKDLADYEIDGKKIPYHLIDTIEAGGTYNVNQFKEDFYQSFEIIKQKNRLPILCGGTGMYIHSILQNHAYTAIPINNELRLNLILKSKDQLINQLQTYPKELIQYADDTSSKRLIRAIEIAEYLTHHDLITIDRPTISPFIIGLKSEVEIRRKQILNRLQYRFNNGLIEEVETLIEQGISHEMLIFYGLEYKFISNYLSNKINLHTLKETLGIAICQFAKRQMTFFRKMEKDGVKINWLDTDDMQLNNRAIELIKVNFELMQLQLTKPL